MRAKTAVRHTGTAANACKRAEPLRVAVVGPWPGLGAADRTGPVRMLHADELETAAPDDEPAEWVLAGPEADDREIQHALRGLGRTRRDLLLAILGHGSDWRRCDRWTRRGCRVYLEDKADAHRVGAAIHAAHTLELTIVDRVFFHARDERGPVPRLTEREHDVLDLIKQGLRNREIGGVLHMSENTVEYHIRHLLEKFSARNRLEVVERATVFGLV